MTPCPSGLRCSLTMMQLHFQPVSNTATRMLRPSYSGQMFCVKREKISIERAVSINELSYMQNNNVKNKKIKKNKKKIPEKKNQVKSNTLSNWRHQFLQQVLKYQQDRCPSCWAVVWFLLKMPSYVLGIMKLRLIT